MKLSNKGYDALKVVCQIVLPAVGALYFALASIWGWPYADAIVGSLAAVNTFIGAVLGISTHNYNKEEGKNDY